MTNLPATLRDAEALNFARDEVQYFRDHRLNLIFDEVSVFENEDGRRVARESGTDISTSTT
jgi:hypothetical protein